VTRVLGLRLGQSVIVLLAVSLLVFVMMYKTGDPVLQMLPQLHTQEQYDRMRAALGLDQPLHVQYFRFLARAVRGDLGVSYQWSKPATGLILDRMPATVELAVTAMIFAVGLALPLGIIAAVWSRGLMTRGILTGSLLGISMPTFVIGILFIYIFGVLPHLSGVGWLPAMPVGGRLDLSFRVPRHTGFLFIDTLWAGQIDAFFNALKHIVLPATTLGLYYLAVLIRLVRGEMIETLSQEYVRVARAKGLRESVVTVKHALRNALVPIVTIVGMQLGGLIGFSVVTETIFQWPGMGKLLIDSIHLSDRPVVMAYLLLVSVIFVVLNLAVDMLYSVIDPRIRVKA
jgi:peptide/nickel transport system permease protein